MNRTILFFLAFSTSITAFSAERPGNGVAKDKARPAPVYSHMPGVTKLSFIENVGQVADQLHHSRQDIQFMMRANGGLNIFISAGNIAYQFNSSAPGKEQEKAMSRIDVRLIGANKNASIIKEELLPYYETYNATKRTAHSYGRITYKDIYPHIDQVLYTDGSKLEYEFVVRPGGRVSDIQLSYGGCTDMHLGAAGELAIAGPQGAITEKAPFTYQEDGKKVASHFVLNGNKLGFAVDTYKGTIVIDPTLDWATYYGGSGDEFGSNIVVDASGNIYMAGNTNSTSAIATSGAFQGTYSGGVYDGMLVKFNSTGTPLWATYFGGSGDEAIHAMAIDGAGNLYIAGFTNSMAGIASSGAHQGSFGGGTYDAFIAKFNGDGMERWATYFGGNASDFAYGLTTDASANVYIAGQTRSTTGIASSGAFQGTIGDGTGTTGDAMLAKFDSTGVRIWSTYLGSDDYDYGRAVTVDPAGNVYLGGFTASDTGLTTPGAYHEAFLGGNYDAFVAKFSSSGVRSWCTYYGGDGDDEILTMVSDASGNIFAGGTTSSVLHIATPGAYHSTYLGGKDGLLLSMDGTGQPKWGTYYGGAGDDYVNSLALYQDRYVYVAGLTNSASDIATITSYQAIYGGGGDDACLAMFDTAGTVNWTTYYGASGTDQGYGVALDAAGNVYMSGQTLSTTGIATTGAFQTTLAGGSVSGDAFLARFSNAGSVAINAPQPGENSIRLYPDPATDRITIDAHCAGQLEIYTPDGRKVSAYDLKAGFTTLALPPGLAAGMYLCRFTCPNGDTRTVRLTCEH